MLYNGVLVGLIAKYVFESKISEWTCHFVTARIILRKYNDFFPLMQILAMQAEAFDRPV